MNAPIFGRRRAGFRADGRRCGRGNRTLSTPKLTANLGADYAIQAGIGTFRREFGAGPRAG